MGFSLPIILPLLGFAPPPEDADYEQAVAQLESAVENFASEDRQASIRALEDLLRLIGRFPDEASGDHRVPETVLQAWIILAGLYLAQGDEAAATEVMDEAIRTARGQALPVRAYGPKVNKLYQDRKDALQAAGMATIAIDCKVDCKIVINERLLAEPSETLFLGTYRVWIKATKGDAVWEYHEVELSAAEQLVTIVYEGPAPVEEEPPPLSLPPPSKPKRMLPRAAEIAGIAVGVGLVVAGAVVLSFDGKCDKTKQPPTADSTPEECGSIYQTTAPGFSLVGVGGGLLVISGVLLSVDEVRVGRERGRQVMVGMSFKF